MENPILRKQVEDKWWIRPLRQRQKRIESKDEIQREEIKLKL